MTTRFRSPGAYTIVDAKEVLCDEDGIVSIVQATN
jgi:hypothetical protein